VRVSDGGREDGKEGGGADTELKTKTPHVNVGNKAHRAFTRPLHYNAFRSITWLTRISEHDNNRAAIPMRSVTRDSRNA